MDVRVVAATNANLARGVDEPFRDDLIIGSRRFRSNSPPWRNARVDILRLAAHFLKRRRHVPSRPEYSMPGRICMLEAHSWPGNVRELQQVMERASILAEGGPIRRRTLIFSDGAQSRARKVGRVCGGRQGLREILGRCRNMASPRRCRRQRRLCPV